MSLADWIIAIVGTIVILWGAWQVSEGPTDRSGGPFDGFQ